jgi:hypothetical protein
MPLICRLPSCQIAEKHEKTMNMRKAVSMSLFNIMRPINKITLLRLLALRLCQVLTSLATKPSKYPIIFSRMESRTSLNFSMAVSASRDE